MDAAPAAEASAPEEIPSSKSLIRQLGRFRREPHRLLAECWQALGDLSRLHFGTVQPVLAIHPDAAQQILQTNARNYDKETRGFGKLKLALGNGLLTSEGAFWKRQRQIIQPGFHRDRLRAFGAVMTDATLHTLQSWKAAAPMDVAAEMTALTLRIIGQTMFSADLAGDSKMLSDTVTLAARHINERIISITGFFDLAEKLPTAKNRRFHTAMRAGDALIHGIIQKRRQSTEDPGDLLSMLMHVRDADSGEGMTDQQLRDEVVTVFSAGHETTALALTWTFYLLSTHPEARRRLQEEVATVLGGRVPTVEDLPRLEYVARVIKEAMRLFPPAWAVSRRALAEDRLGPHRLPANSFVLLSPYLTHRHPAFWDNPEGFDPDRFLPEREHARHRFAYFPFGGGARMCIGRDFALMESQLVLATIAQRFELHLAPAHPIELEPLITLRSRHGMRMTAHPLS